VVSPMYMLGRVRTCSMPSSTLIMFSVYEASGRFSGAPCGAVLDSVFDVLLSTAMLILCSCRLRISIGSSREISGSIHHVTRRKSAASTGDQRQIGRQLQASESSPKLSPNSGPIATFAAAKNRPNSTRKSPLFHLHFIGEF